MVAEYELRVYSPSTGTEPYFLLKGIMSPMSFLWSFVYRTAINNVGSFTATISKDDPHVSWFEKNSLIEVRRRLKGLEFETQNTYVIRYLQDDKSNTKRLTLGGPDLTGYILNSRVVVPQSGSIDGYERKTAVADVVIKDFVQENCGLGASILRRYPEVIVNGYLPAFAAGSIISEAARYDDTVFEVVKRASQAGTIDFECVLEFIATEPFIIFRTGTFGTDRTSSQAASGIQTVIFNSDFNTIKNIKRLQDDRKAKRVVYVLGSGKGMEQEVVTYPVDITSLSLWDRTEGSVNASQVEAGDTTGLETAANDFIDKNKPVDDLSFKIIQSENQEFGRHYFLGDRVTVIYEDFEQDYRITRADVFLSGNGETIDITTEIA